MASASRWFLLLHLGFCTAWMDERPVLESRDGHLVISSAKDRNITLKILGGGSVNVNEINLLHVASAAQNATRVIDRWRMGYLAEMENSLHQLTTIVTGSEGLQKRLTILERGIDANANSTNRTANRSDLMPYSMNRAFHRLQLRVKGFEDRLRAMETLLRQNECHSDPCRNGGTCEDLYDGYQCHCTSNWEGPNCMTDVNECARFLGTDLGCQNGATCRNLPGYYQCDCLPGWFGLHCTQKTSICNTENSAALCGDHGVCVAKNSPLGYTCICDQGWESDGTSPACTKDVDECAADHPPCSVNPPVPCRNTRGSFTCGACPPGYSGNGYYCIDIDECRIINGGCSISPFVNCINTMGSRVCGSCPIGYRGDGVSCTFVGGCAVNNGGCHPLASCTENSAITNSYVMCHCPEGYIGSGIGPNGCQLTVVSVNTACSSNPCVHGTCLPNGANGFTCTCNAGYSGTTCNVLADPCSPNPCRNSGVCVVLNGQASCQCTPTFTGSRCETPRQTCGGVLRNPTGTFQFPIDGSTYQHRLTCAWVLTTLPTKVLNVTFTNFHLEQSADCKFDFLQIHDGKSAGSQMINRFCGNSLPNTNGTIISSHNSLYLWFHSDSSISHDGFAFNWTSIDPICGGVLRDNYGTIMSPGSPGRYPPNRDCFWQIIGPVSRRIQFHFGQLMLEEHPTCENDYLEIISENKERLGIYCNHTRPPPLNTPTSEAEVHFHSDGTGQDVGFQIHYTAVEALPGCGGVFTTPSGTITSPGHSAAYHPNMQCEWKIQLPLNEQIQASWLLFDLENSPGCMFDNVEIYDGPDTQAKLLGRYCGPELPPTIKSTSNTMVVVFKSDWSFEMEGFTLAYETFCGGEFREENGTITSPLYPKKYPPSIQCSYQIILPADKKIILTIVDLDIEDHLEQVCHNDDLEIYDGDNENARMLAKICGDVHSFPNVTYYSTHNYMLLRFTSDSIIAGRGFKVNYTSTSRQCGGLLKEPNGFIRPPLHDRSVDCIWTIQAPSGYGVQLTWLSFNLIFQSHCFLDYVEIYENYTISLGNVVAKYCGPKKPPTVTTQGPALSIVYHRYALRSHRIMRSDLAQNTTAGYKFVASYVFVDLSKNCGGHYLKSSGVLRSPNYPDNYVNEKECVWVIEALNKHRIVLTVKHFELEEHPDCNFDYLEIRNGGYESSPLIGKFCESNIPTEIQSHSNQLYIKFVTDFVWTAKGFEIEWDSTTQGCGGAMTEFEGAIVSPNYPEPYTYNADCLWKITIAAGSMVHIIIEDLYLEYSTNCQHDFIEIFEGVNQRVSKGRYCGTSYPKDIFSESNEITVRFRSDFSNSARGFSLRYETKCNNKLRGHYGVIESPNFPNSYEKSLNCSWIIEAPVGNKINLTFSHFQLEENDMRCHFDYLKIKEGENDTPNTDIGQYCGDEIPKKITSTQHQIFLTFITDNSLHFKGFRLEWVVHGCGGHFTRPTDTFTSPGYPNGYSQIIACEWLIEVDYTHSIELTLQKVNIDKRKECASDKIQIYAGSDANSPQLTSLCYSEKPVIYTSSGNKMFVKFYSSTLYNNRGFNASYKSVPLLCGGKFTTTSGIIHSPNYPKNYPHRQNCEWLLEVDTNHVVNITFLDFDIENSRNCTDDFVKIFDGPTKDYPLLGTHCRNQLPPSYVSTSNQMLVVMQSDTLISAKGFQAHYHRACGARIIVKNQGILTHPGNHIDVNCTWTLSAEDPDDHVTLTFTHIGMHISNPNSTSESPCLRQYIEVFEGESTNGPLLEKRCGVRNPRPIISTGNSLTVLLSEQYEFNGYFTATYSVANTACGGNYTSLHGFILSPNYPRSYPRNSECTWFINTSPGNGVQLSDMSNRMKTSENCDEDYIEIRKESATGELIKVICGTLPMQNFVSNTSLWIKFRSDADEADDYNNYFMIIYHILPNSELNGPFGRVTSPMYPLPYRETRKLNWRITVDMLSIIRIEFRDFYIENKADLCPNILKIYDGYDEDAPTLLETCDFSLPDPIQSSSNIVYITLVCEYIREGNWFDFTWLQIPKETINTDDNFEIKLSECNKEIAMVGDSNNTYAFSSPGWPTGYEDNLRCKWVFTSPPGTHLALRIITMDLEETMNCIADSVSVYSGYVSTSTSDANLKDTLCLSNSTMSLVETDNVMTVIFESDSSYNKTGFNAYVYRDCGGHLTGPNGVIDHDNSSFSRALHRWHYTCEWTIEVKPGRTVSVEILDMLIHNGNDVVCSENYLLLKNGGDAHAPLLGDGKYCNVIPEPLETTGNHLYVKIVGNGPFVRLKLAYREVSMNCGGEFILTNKQKEWEISSPNYPSIPQTYTECFWRAIAPAGERLSIHFLDRFDLSYSPDCDREYVEVKDGGTDSSKVLGKFCRDELPNSVTTSGNMMYIHFYTDVAEPKNGFKASIKSSEFCGAILRGISGVVTSPNYPHSYPKNQSCSWWIIGPKDHTLKLQFRDIQLPSIRYCNRNDYVEIEEKLADDSLAKIGTYCGYQKPELIETASNTVHIHFRSDNRDFVTYRGFSINYTASQETCGGLLTTQSGIIKSPGYPNPRTKTRYCDWRIKLDVGYQIVVNILDLDIINTPESSSVRYSLSFYNDFRFKSKIKILGQASSTQTIKSSSNTMIIGYWASVGHRGFKLEYSASAPAPCGGILNNIRDNVTGPTSLPFNETSFVCNWKFQPPQFDADNFTGLTLTIKVTGYVGKTGSNSTFGRNCLASQYIELQNIGMICGNFTEPIYLRSPLPLNYLTIMNGTYGKPMSFDLQYEHQPCGGILHGPSHTISSPKGIPYPINCAWYIQYPDNDETIGLTFHRLNVGSCDKGHIIVRNGGVNSPEYGKFCGNIKPQNITSVSNQLWIEYFAADDPNDFEIHMTNNATSEGCGGALRSYSREISSPKFPRQYPKNSECTWEIMGNNGYHIGLAFVERFSLETSTNCEKDYVQIFDWISEEESGNGEWKSLGKVCGRNTPAPFNSTSNRMKVIFHSNEEKQLDGFRAVWSENCGGIFQATETVKTIQSPSYPNLYPSNVSCNYTIVAPDENVIVEFTDFQLERGRADCRYDNVTITSENLYLMTDTESYCGDDKPPLLRSLSRVEIIFMTDKFVQRNGFQFKYFINKCGGIITKPSELKPLMYEENYFGNMNCTWIIKAPEGKGILVRFEKLLIEFSTTCHFDSVAIYNGSSIRLDNRIAIICGNLTDHLPSFKSDSNSMVVNFISDSSQHFGGFAAKVLFTTSSANGCGGAINLETSKTFRTQQAATYQSLEECHWTVVTSEDKNIRLTINSMDIKNSISNISNSQSDKCNGDYLEVHDGGPYGKFLGQYCGNVAPFPIVSSSNVLWIKFYTDGTVEGAGATGTLDIVNSLCGLSNREINETDQILTSPNYPNSYKSGVQCWWILEHSDKYTDRLRIQFEDFELSSSNKCEDEYLEITEDTTYINEGFGKDFIYNGNQKYPITVEMGSYLPYASYKYCGNELPHDYYSYSNKIHVTFKSVTSGHKGFKLKYSTAKCDRNYTSEQGRIVHRGFTDCWITITAPKNYTISLYFNQFSLYDPDHCTHNALQVHDGDSSGPLLNTLCSFATPNPIFSTGNKLTLHSWAENANSYQTYDIIYTTTNAGRGCGGRIFNYGGRFTSPLYPGIYRNNTVCTWDVSVPRGFKIKLQFTFFDIGTKKSCGNNNVKIYDVLPSGELLRSTYCGEDNPASIESENNRILVKYTTTVNNIGTGWVIVFLAQSTTHPLMIIDR